jgi:FkbM family methyltransferase
MKTRRRKFEELLWVLGLHAPARRLFSATIGRSAAEARAKMTDFYRAIVQPGTLVFDIGANVGVLSAVFASVGARVVAVEPNPDCVRHIQLSYPDDPIEVLQAAVGAKNGLAVLNISDERDVRSSISENWMKTMGQQDSSYAGIWTRDKVVSMVTLDVLIEHFGMPYFIKIDVEGSEGNVLCGLSKQPQLLSFEFTAAFLNPALSCLDMGIFKEGSRFNFAYNEDWGYPVQFAQPDWLGKPALEKALQAVEGSELQGDIFVKAP